MITFYNSLKLTSYHFEMVLIDIWPLKYEKKCTYLEECCFVLQWHEHNASKLMGGIDFAATQAGLMHMRTAILQHVSLNVMIDSSYGKVT